MALLSIVTEPDPRLHICSEEVPKVTDEIRRLMDDMLETMYHSEGIGLAAVQVGIHKRVIVMDLDYPQERYSNPNAVAQSNPLYMVNPKIVDSSEDENIYQEGCLSFPGQYAKVIRPKEVTVEYLDYDGLLQRMHCTGLLATCVQHEIDHINGVVFVDHLSKLKRDLIVRKLKKAQQLRLNEE